jgi:hypothetical protein
VLESQVAWVAPVNIESKKIAVRFFVCEVSFKCERSFLRTKSSALVVDVEFNKYQLCHFLIFLMTGD